MKICFIWVKEFRNFNNFGLNLSSDYIYEFDELTKSLSRKEQKPLPSNFYSEGVSDVTGLFGKNGSGKSNCLELICMLLKGGKSKVKADFLIVYDRSGRIYCDFSMKDPGFLGPINNFEMIHKKYNKEISGLNVIYFSNVYDRRPNDFSQQVSDLSMNNLAKKSRQKVSVFFEQIDFIDSNKFQLLEIPAPSHFCIEIDITPKFYTLLFKDNLDKELSNLHKVVISRLRDLKTKTKFLLALNYSIFSNFIMSAIAFDEDSLQAIKLSFNSHLSDSNLNSKDLSQKLLEITLELLKEYFPTKEQNKYEDYLDNMCQLQNLVSLIEIENIRKTSKKESFVVNLKNSKSEELVVLLECLRNNNKVSCSWLGVSSGHIAYLNLFSSIYKELYRSRNDVILCIDEGDLYLHPQWQIEFFDKLLSVLPNLSSGKVQLILTSHSPFLLSDLPNQSITVLTSDASGVAMSGSDIEQKTFGANLYELYSNLFFLNKSRTGVFANNKIKKLLEQIESTDTDISQKDINIFSEMIGDKVIKHILDKGINND